MSGGDCFVGLILLGERIRTRQPQRGEGNHICYVLKEKKKQIVRANQHTYMIKKVTTVLSRHWQIGYFGTKVLLTIPG